MKNSFFIIGLGNITSKYLLTRHNVGFLCLECISGILNANYTNEAKWLGMEGLSKAMMPQLKWRNDKRLDSIIASIPLTDFIAPLGDCVYTLQNLSYFKQDSSEAMQQRFINLSKINDISSYQVILAAPTTFMNNSGIAVRKIQSMYDNVQTIVIYDDLDTPFGTFNIKLKGGDGGHNGIKSINAHCGKEYLRVKLGIGANLFANQIAFNKVKDMYDDLLSFDFLNECYSFVLSSRLKNNKQFKTKTFFKILKQHIIEQINLNESNREKINEQIDILLMDFIHTHKTLGQDVARYVLSDFNMFEMALLPSILKYASFSIMCLIFDKIISGSFSCVNSFNINYK
ncbi:peptidyl-tRNA hydrolase [Helicobacter muridarum]|uniref:Peptidyl-tRNA hydrolase n=1 Tax=Helicobacter muridarum TaxID=216 RepID=A0A377PTV7_9HELI|nr:aminoacyl-tRNA hydrolase [Helicobacter muridarum]TLD98662.1 peptidyl-tRNA hydrolase [Helicobacter muridarum]STQ86378.1 Peptidyl-tRNA hydrolase [Helicobacter muridarum]